MTTTSEVTFVEEAGNGTKTAFSFAPMKLFKPKVGEDHAVEVVKVNDTTGVETPLSEGTTSTTYSVQVTTYPGTGTVTYPAIGGTPLLSTERILIKPKLPLKQGLDLNNQGGYLPDTLETQLDKFTKSDLQQQEELDRAVKARITDTSFTPDLPRPSADGFLRVNSAGTGFVYHAQLVGTASASNAIPVNITTGGGAAGVSDDYARADHVHDIGTVQDLVNDTTPQLGGNLDANTQSILMDTGTGIKDESGNEQLIFSTTASAINQFQMKNAAVAGAPALSVTGDDTNISMSLIPKGTGGVRILDGNSNEVLIAGPGTASAVNEFTVTNAATAGDPTLAVTGGDTNISMDLVSKGTGTVKINGVMAGPHSVLSTAQATTSGTSINFPSIPSWVKKITIQFVGVGVSGTSPIVVRIGPSGGVETTGYLGTAAGITTSVVSTNYTAGFGITNTAGAVAAARYHGTMVLTLENAAAFTWVASGNLAKSNVAGIGVTAGSKSLAAVLTQLSLTTLGGTDTFAAGAVNILME